MILRPDPGISTAIGVILLIFLTLVLVGGVALIFFGFADNLADEKQVYLTTEATGNSTHPLAIQI